MMSNAGKLNTKAQREAAINRLLDQFRPIVAQAINSGIEIGANEKVRELAAQLTGAELTPVKRRDKTTKGLVECPYPNCKNPGIKPNNCFCKEHFLSLSEKDKKKYREMQLARRAEARKKNPANDKSEKKTAA